MAPPPPPSTPKLSSSRDPSTASPGTWRHPRLQEIVRRQNESSFGDKNIRKILWNGGTLIFTGFFGTTFKYYSLALGSLLQISTYPDAILLVFRLFLLLNIVAALYPLYQTKDDISDIPLTPSQRSLLGLDPNRTPPTTPGTQYLTPPRYRLSTGSRKTGSVSPSGSPLSGRGISPSGRRPSNSSPFTPSPSPLLHKTFPIGSRDTGRRHSFGSPSPLGQSSISIRDGSVFRTSSSPSASFGKGSGQVLTNKWLYEKNRMMSSGSSIFSQ